MVLNHYRPRFLFHRLFVTIEKIPEKRIVRYSICFFNMFGRNLFRETDGNGILKIFQKNSK